MTKLDDPIYDQTVSHHQHMEHLSAQIASEYRRRVMHPFDYNEQVGELDKLIQNARLNGINMNGGRLKVINEAQLRGAITHE